MESVDFSTRSPNQTMDRANDATLQKKDVFPERNGRANNTSKFAKHLEI